MLKTLGILTAAALFLPVLTAGSGAAAAPEFTLNIIHVNDTHSRFDPVIAGLTLDLDDELKGKRVYAELGGYSRAADVIGRLRAAAANPVLIHAGDLVQGSIYFTRYGGAADMAFWNRVKPDIATPGNHEFDKGSDFLFNVIFGKATFPFVSSNVDFSGDPELAAAAPAPWVIKEIGSQRVGFAGATTVDTPLISSPGKKIIFKDPVSSVQKAVDELIREGVNKIVLVSHLGYEADRALAAAVTGLDVIVGGHSHTLLGGWRAAGPGERDPYPVVLKDKAGGVVLLVQAWEWAKVIGALKVDFDAGGRVISWSGEPVSVVGGRWFRVYDLPDPRGELKRVQFTKDDGADTDVREYDGKDYVPVAGGLRTFYLGYLAKLEAVLSGTRAVMTTDGDSAINTLTAGYAEGVKEMKKTTVALVGEDMKRGLNTGPGFIVADSMRARTGARIAINNAGGVRSDLPQGPLTVAQVHELLPFDDTIVLMNMNGADVVRALEDGVDAGLKKYGGEFPDRPLIYVSGIRFEVDGGKKKGGRLSKVLVLEGGVYSPMDPAGTYSVAVNSFISEGGDFYDTLKTVPGKMDTGYGDAEVLLEFVKDKTLRNPEPRITISR